MPPIRVDERCPDRGMFSRGKITHCDLCARESVRGTVFCVSRVIALCETCAQFVRDASAVPAHGGEGEA